MESVTREIGQRFFPIQIPGVYIPRPPLEVTPRLIDKLNLAGANIVCRYASEEKIKIGWAFKDDIHIFDTPLDVLPFIPLVFGTISDHGNYTVTQWVKPIGRAIYRVTYDGMPEQDRDRAAIIGVKTVLEPKEKADNLEFGTIYTNKSRLWPLDFWKERTENGV